MKSLRSLALGAVIILSIGGIGLSAGAAAALQDSPHAAAQQPGANFWLASSSGGVWNFGDAQPLGSLANVPLARPIVGITPTHDGGGYWLVASDGGIFSYGDATFYGSTGSIHLNQPIVGMAATPDDGGYWLVASDGGIFNYGDAVFSGSAGSLKLNAPVVGISGLGFAT
jgi:hypothetical protein